MAVTERLRCRGCDAVYERALSEDGSPLSDWHKTTDGRGDTCPNCATRGKAA